MDEGREIQNQQSRSLRSLFTLLSHCRDEPAMGCRRLGRVVVARVRGVFIENSAGFDVSG